MDFRLRYEGPLPAEGGRTDIRTIKHAIRKMLHPQLADLCERNPELSGLVARIRGRRVLDPSDPLRDFYDSDLSHVGQKYRFGAFEFVPLVVDALHMVCHLDILFLRREKPGSLIVKPKDEYGGDLDNRIKVFLDALRVPREPTELPTGAAPDADEQPFYCLLEDDSLITKLGVESDTLLGAFLKDQAKEVQLMVRVTTKLTRSTPANIGFSV